MGERNESVLMANNVVGKIVDFPRQKPVGLYDCPMCPVYRKAIRDYLDGYASRRMHEEGAALMKLKAVLGDS